MSPRKGVITVIAPLINSVQIDGSEWVKVADKDRLAALRVGDVLEDKDDKPEIKVEKPAEGNKAAEAKRPAPAAGVPFRAGYGEPLTEYDLRKDKQILVSGLMQALIQSSLVLRLEDLEAATRKALDIHKKLVGE